MAYRRLALRQSSLTLKRSRPRAYGRYACAFRTDRSVIRSALLLVASFFPVAAQAQQPADSSLRGDSGLAYTSRTANDEFDQYRTGARFSDLLVVRGERVGLRVSPAAGPLGLTGRLL